MRVRPAVRCEGLEAPGSRRRGAEVGADVPRDLGGRVAGARGTGRFGGAGAGGAGHFSEVRVRVRVPGDAGAGCCGAAVLRCPQTRETRAREDACSLSWRQRDTGGAKTGKPGSGVVIRMSLYLSRRGKSGQAEIFPFEIHICNLAIKSRLPCITVQTREFGR